MAKTSVALAESGERKSENSFYDVFNVLDGNHPWMASVPEGYITYQVRRLPGGKVSYFNWDLAKEMGLVGVNHWPQMNRILEQKILDTFCLRIINEWDQTHQVQYPRNLIKPNKYMATRYLQLQHSDRLGRTSGDGRCIWNGVVSFQNKIWDVSSRGTGVTALAPGAVMAGKPLKSGNNEVGYGCGMAEIDELYAAAIMAEIFHKNSIVTERLLCIIDLGHGVGIGVRAGLNLIRPAHLFVHLRQGQYDRLQKAADYLIDRQNRNGQWNFSSQKKRKYDLMLEEITICFAKLAADLEREYIFAWLDWDGDNVLANGGLIDYGSIRQFGLRHDQYRYEDVDRYSTNLNQQRAKARLIVQTFVQLTDYLKTKIKKPLQHFQRHPSLRDFDRCFQQFLLEKFLFQVGLSSNEIKLLMDRHKTLVRRFYQEFSFFETAKTHKKISRVADGVNRPAIFNMRTVLRQLPQHFLMQNGDITKLMKDDMFFSLMLTDFATGKDRKMTRRWQQKIRRFQSLYGKLLSYLMPKNREGWGVFFQAINERAQNINRVDRMTGNALIYVVDELLKARSKGFSDQIIQNIMTAIIEDQAVCLESRELPLSVGHQAGRRLYSQVLTLVQNHNEEI
ncbi:MAG: hypothetical protein K1X29_02300 [Bdellovibrionales bacterium]|nr:hypothetical protein [Bdellovibrionales bacterium]